MAHGRMGNPPVGTTEDDDLPCYHRMEKYSTDVLGFYDNSPFAQSIFNILNFKLSVEGSTQPLPL